MPSFLERYQNGEREQVWAELNALGPRVRDRAYFADATAVAQETMRRARHNVETLIVRLEKLGYEFQTTSGNAAGALAGLGQALSMLKAADQLTARSDGNPHVDRLRQQSRGMLDNPIFKNLLGSLEKQSAAPTPTEALKNPNVYAPPDKRVVKDLRTFEKSIGGPIPLSLRAWCEIVGSVSLIGSHPVLCFRENPQKS